MPSCVDSVHTAVPAHGTRTSIAIPGYTSTHSECTRTSPCVLGCMLERSNAAGRAYLNTTTVLEYVPGVRTGTTHADLSIGGGGRNIQIQSCARLTHSSTPCHSPIPLQPDLDHLALFNLNAPPNNYFFFCGNFASS